MSLTNRAYNALKYVAQVVIPTVATLYFAVANIWGLPFAEEVVGTLTAVDAALGGLLQLSSDSYAKNNVDDGVLIATETEDRINYSLELNSNDLEGKDKLTFAIKRN